ncbi:MAG: pesticin C-terminus-like muramidase [Nevskia sp.]|nr:pesticin C-terminus-like muramidase [Nevskia sp.]
MRPQLHLEIFTGDDIEGFIAKSRAYAAKLDESQKTQFSIEVGAQLCQPAAPDQTLAAGVAVKVLSGADAGKGPWQRVQPLKTVILARGVLGAYNAKSGGHGSYVYQGQHADFTGRYLGATDTVSTTDAEEGKKAIYTRREVHMPEGQPVWVERSLGTDAAVARAAWRIFPLQLSAAKAPIAAQLRVIGKSQLGKLGSHESAQDEHGTHWWKISVGTSDQGSAEGWVCEKAHPKTRWTSPWDWPGFDIVGESAPPKDFLQRNLHLNDAAQDAAEAKNFKVKADALDGGPLLATLKSAIDAQGKKDGVITAGELRKSLRQPWLAERIGKLIVRYESEWGGDMSKWDALDPLMFEGEPNWKAEKARIRKLRIWDQVKAIAGFPTESEVKHFHLGGIVGNFGNICPEECLVDCYELPVKGGAYRVSKEAFKFILSEESYRRKPYVPEGSTSSGVTVGYGYDIGQQQAPTVKMDFSGIYTKDEIDKLVTAVGLTGKNATLRAAELAAIEISEADALKLATRMKQRYAESVITIYPEAVKLHPHCQGALLSLVINRGTSLTQPSEESRREMKEIQEDLASGSLVKIPDRIRSMKRLWENKGLGGLLRRRDGEANFFERGLKCDCWEWPFYF